MSSTLFNGTSRYSTDFQAVIDRSVAIASLPLQQMKAGLTSLTDESTALSSLEQAFSSFGSAISNLETAAGASSYSATTSDGNVTATISGSAGQGSYTVEVTHLGAYTNAMSVGTAGGALRVVDPAETNLYGSGSTGFSLTLNGGDSISLTASTLNELVDEINAKAGDSVQATLVDVGSTDGEPDYRLAVQSRQLSADTIELSSGATLLLNELTAGHKVNYKVNGAAVAESDSRTITLSPGISVALNKKSDADSPTTISIGRNTASMASALHTFADAYNTVVDAIDSNRGEGNTALSGQGILYTLSDLMRGMATYQDTSNPLGSAATIGLELDKDGHMSLNAIVFSAAAQSNAADLADWLGGASSGGFVKNLTDLFNQAEDADTGSLKSAIKLAQDQISAQNDRIDTEQTRIDDLTESLRERMAAADALIATLEQQASYITSMFESMRIASQGYSQ